MQEPGSLRKLTRAERCKKVLMLFGGDSAPERDQQEQTQDVEEARVGMGPGWLEAGLPAEQRRRWLSGLAPGCAGI